jgi:general secretion pathway protein G
MKNTFSLLEVIFVITVISIISLVAIPKFFYNIDNANIIKLKSDVALIREKINQEKNRQILLNLPLSLDDLESSNIMPPLTTTNSAGQWSKVSTNHYKAWINSTIFVEFKYNKNSFTFDCDIATNQYCKELTQ